MKRIMRLKKNPLIRELTSEMGLSTYQLIQPLFTVEGLKTDEDILGLRETKRQNLDRTLAQIESDLEAGVRHFILFNVPTDKKLQGFQHAYSQKVIDGIKKRFGESLYLWVDTCLCSLTSHGHCCVFNNKGDIELNQTLSEISNTALAYAQAGADGISPSDMMDGRVAAIRKKLDENGLGATPIMSYSTKFASNFYGPFRNAAQSAPQFGDRKSYQLDVRNRSEALAASVRCAEEGAEILMVKPGMSSIDLLAPIHEKTGLQVGAYQVSGEFASLHFLAEKGLIQFNEALLETWYVFKRAGAQFIITYGARNAKALGVKAP